VFTFSVTEGFGHHIKICFLTDEQNCRPWNEPRYPMGGFDAVKFRHSDIEQNQIRLQFFGFLDGL